MTVFDLVLMVIFALAVLWGLKKGFIDSVLTVVAVYVALLLSGQFASRLVNFFTDKIEGGAVATVIGYIVIFVVVFIVARIIGMVLRTGIKFLMLGWVDKTGGLAFGAIAGVLLVSGTVAAAARFTYDPDTKLPVNVSVGAFGERLRGWMVDGIIPSRILDIRDALPGDFLGIMPQDFGESLDALKQDIERKEGTKA